MRWTILIGFSQMNVKKVVVAVGLLCLLVSPGLGEQGPSPEETRYPLRARCAMNLLEVGEWLQIFALAKNGALPSKLSEAFVDTSGANWRCLVCPADAPEPVEGGFYTSYAYVNVAPGGRKLRENGKDILAFDAQPVHQGGRNVLFSNMEVRYLKEPEFQKLLAEERARFLKRGKTLEIVRQDFIPLTETQLRNFKPSGQSFLGSVHFKITAAIVLAIGVVLVLLAMLRRKRRRATSS